MGTEAVWIPAVMALAAGGASYYNTERTADKQDSALANQILNQSRKQQEADAKVSDQVRELEGSTAQDERAERLGDYLDIVARKRGTAEAGLTPGLGSDRFQTDATTAAEGTNRYAGKMADLMSRIDAAGMQRQGEGFGYGKLATDLGLIGREASGQNFLDQLKASRIRRSPWLDAASAAMSGAAGGMGGAGGAAGAGSMQGFGNNMDNFMKAGWGG